MGLMWNRNNAVWAALAVILSSVIFSAGLYAGVNLPKEGRVFNVLHQTPTIPPPKDVDFGLFWQALNKLETKYVDIDGVDPQKMVYGAISGLFKSTGDPYTVFFPPKENEEFQTEIKGEFEGVGMEIGIRKGILTVIAPLKDTPAERAGIKSGDKVLKIGDEASAELSVEEAVGLIRGPHGTKVKLTILRNGEDETKTIEVERAVIKIPVIDTETDKTVAKVDGQPGKETDLGDIFVIRLYNFSEDSVSQFRQALRKMLLSGKTKLILDLRNNPGGYLEAAVDISSWFLPQGKVVVVEDSGSKEEKRYHRSRGYDIFDNLPMVILINQGSASASEIVAGALHDHGIAKLVGEKSFGKGSVQEFLPLTADTSIKITVAKWLTPNGDQISEKGLTPDVEVKIEKADIEAKRDPQMEKAVEMLKGM